MSPHFRAGPGPELPARAGLALIRFYRRWLRGLKPPVCRFRPTCSEYALQAIAHCGLLRGSLRAIWRLLRCNPFSAGGWDPGPWACNDGGRVPGASRQPAPGPEDSLQARPKSRGTARTLPLLLLILLLPLLAGCFGPMNVPMPLDRLVSLRAEFQELDRADDQTLNERKRTLTDETKNAAKVKDRALRAALAHKQLLLGYCWERLGQFKSADANYSLARQSEYASVATFRIAQVTLYQAERYQADADDASLAEDERDVAKALLQETRTRAVKILEQAANYPPAARVLVRSPRVATLQPAQWTIKDIRHEAYASLDPYYSQSGSYKVMEWLVRICGGPQRHFSYVLSLVLLSVLAKLITTPLSLSQFKSMREMQAIQPLLKKIQEKYKGDKPALAREQMALFKEHKINPASSCLPMLIQLPILWWVYFAIRHFTFRYMSVPFLYLPSLGDPDVIPGHPSWPGPLLLLYGLSMYFSQKLISPPATTPEQRQQQKLLAYMMPVMLVVIFRSLPAAFILYWLLMNILMTGHQYLIMRPHRLAEAAAAVGDPERSRRAAGDQAPPKPPPPAAIEKLSQGTRPSPKKKKRR